MSTIKDSLQTQKHLHKIATSVSNKAQDSQISSEQMKGEALQAGERIAVTKSQIDEQQSIIDNPPTIEVPKGGKKGGSKTEVDEQAVAAAKAQVNSLTSQMQMLESDLATAEQNANSENGKAKQFEGEAEGYKEQAQTLKTANTLMDKMQKVLTGEDKFFNKREEESAIETLKAIKNETQGWEGLDTNKDGVEDGKVVSDAIAMFLDPEQGYPAVAPDDYIVDNVGINAKPGTETKIESLQPEEPATVRAVGRQEVLEQIQESVKPIVSNTQVV